MKYLIWLIILLIPITSFSSYNNIDDNIKNVYQAFYSTVEEKNSYDSWLSFLKKLNQAIINLKENKDLSLNNYSKISDLEKLNNEKIFELEFKNSQKETKDIINWSELFKNFKHKVFNDKVLTLENWVWYSYDFEKMYYFNNTQKITYNDLIKNWINPETDLIIKWWDQDIAFVNEFAKFKVVDNDIIYWIPNKLDTISFLKKSNRYLRSDIDNDLIKIKKTSKDITKWVTNKDEIIKIIYAYILDNIEYSNDFKLSDYEIYSWIETFKNKDWVCEWYVELFSLMLWFNWIESNIIKWDVIDAVDFPNVWHAWTKVWNYYYDITFDDPIWANKTKKYSEYEYFKLPKDLFYTNRYDFWETPEELKNTSKEYRTQLIRTNLYKLVDKYKDYDYNILKPIIFRKNNNIGIEEEIKVEDIIDIYDFYTFREYKIYFENETKTVDLLSYTLLENFSIKTLLKDNNYDLSSKILLKWEIDNSDTQYIMVNEISYR